MIVSPFSNTREVGPSSRWQRVVCGVFDGCRARSSVVNKYCQTWDCHNVFTVGANVFGQNAVYNPTGPVGALAYWTADAIKNRYMKSPSPLVSA